MKHGCKLQKKQKTQITNSCIPSIARRAYSLFHHARTPRFLAQIGPLPTYSQCLTMSHQIDAAQKMSRDPDISPHPTRPHRGRTYLTLTTSMNDLHHETLATGTKTSIFQLANSSIQLEDQHFQVILIFSRSPLADNPLTHPRSGQIQPIIRSGY